MSSPRSGAISIARAGQVMLSMPGKEVRPRVTLRSGVVSAEFRAPARARLRVIHGCLGGLPRRETGWLRRRQGRSEEMNAGAAFTAVCRLRQTARFGVVGKFCALV